MVAVGRAKQRLTPPSDGNHVRRRARPSLPLAPALSANYETKLMSESAVSHFRDSDILSLRLSINLCQRFKYQIKICH
jgi:hypothetical protein